MKPIPACPTAGGLNRVARVGEVFGMANAPPGFTDHLKVISGCSDLFVGRSLTAGVTPARPQA